MLSFLVEFPLSQPHFFFILLSNSAALWNIVKPVPKPSPAPTQSNPCRSQSVPRGLGLILKSYGPLTQTRDTRTCCHLSICSWYCSFNLYMYTVCWSTKTKINTRDKFAIGEPVSRRLKCRLQGSDFISDFSIFSVIVSSCLLCFLIWEGGASWVVSWCAMAGLAALLQCSMVGALWPGSHWSPQAQGEVWVRSSDKKSKVRDFYTNLIFMLNHDAIQQ